MTIEVRIENVDKTRSIRVGESCLDRESGRREVGNFRWVNPGWTETFHVHLLKDLILQEVEP